MIKFTLRDKTPNEDQVYSVDWTPYIGADTLNGVPTMAPLEGTIVAHNVDNPDTHTTRFWLRGGVRGEVSKLLLHQPTQAGQVLEAEVVLGVR